MIPDWQTDCAYFSDLLPGRHANLWQGLERVLAQSSVATRLLQGTRDIWCRDYMPVQIENRMVRLRRVKIIRHFLLASPVMTLHNLQICT